MPAKYHTKITLGASIGTKKPTIHTEHSRMDIPMMLYESFPSKMRPSAPPQMFKKTITLINQKCIFDERGCCLRGNECKFVHTNTLGEKVQSCIILDDQTYLEPVQVRVIQCCQPKEVASNDNDEEPIVDARIYFAGLASYLTDAWVRRAVEPFGQVDQVRILPSKFDSGKKAGFIHMTSESGARAAIDHLHTCQFDGVFLKADLQYVGDAVVTAPPPKKTPPNDPPISKFASVPCKFFMIGKCSKGSMCRFSHDVSSNESAKENSPVSSKETKVAKEKPTKPDADGFTMVSSRTKSKLSHEASKTPLANAAQLDDDRDATPVKLGVDDALMLNKAPTMQFGSKESVSEGFDNALLGHATETRVHSDKEMLFVTLPNDAGGDCGLFAIDQAVRNITESSRDHTNMYRHEIVSFYVSNLKKVAPAGMTWEKFVLGASEDATGPFGSFADYLAFIEEDGAQIGTAEMEALAMMKNLHIEIFDAHDHSKCISSHGTIDGTLVQLVYDETAKHYELATLVPPDMPSLEVIDKDRATHSPHSVILDTSNPWGETTRSFNMRNELSLMRVAGY